MQYLWGCGSRRCISLLQHNGESHRGYLGPHTVLHLSDGVRNMRKWSTSLTLKKEGEGMSAILCIPSLQIRTPIRSSYIPLRIYRLHSIFHLMVSKTGSQPRF